ncbi:MAG: alpha-hydroxy-acid oxidizing enzyme [Flammeovirgaceae bacterium]|nr:alpha-hydroxy-acid oxidizing enzyme [Flammeovirgaceae bacterium]MBE62584.1 alpha-hydroxy-acid oxidizing enzyme [Flammeovirgaceae bacterium]HCX24336.1 alpha-hydroxy-acid oxidizing enzyme [Cytophagales bacterium]|tara:strand:+ start:52 stop:1200 length:1149 start_codon:yes stop_codon:yes gene_type:complete
MKEYINPKYAEIELLRQRAKRKIPPFAYEYLDGGCNSEISIRRNTNEIRQLLLKPYYLKNYTTPDLSVELFGKRYDLPFGISPIGLQGMMWPGASEILAKAAGDYNIPYILSTVGTASIEEIGDLAQGNAWFQLYNPKEESLRNDLLKRAEVAGYPVLVILADVPTFGYRSKEIRNGLAIPPKMTLRNISQIMTRPHWALSTLAHGVPEFKTLKPYIPRGLSLKHLGLFMDKTFDGRLSEEKVKELRDKWKGKLVIKGLENEEDVEKVISIGLDGVIVSNHGGRQLDNGRSTIKSMPPIVDKFRDQITVMMDSGVRTGPDIACTLASGAEFAFLGRSFMYGVSALGKKGGDHTVSILRKQLTQVLNQLCCPNVSTLKEHLTS